MHVHILCNGSYANGSVTVIKSVIMAFPGHAYFLTFYLPFMTSVVCNLICISHNMYSTLVAYIVNNMDSDQPVRLRSGFVMFGSLVNVCCISILS